MGKIWKNDIVLYCSKTDVFKWGRRFTISGVQMEVVKVSGNYAWVRHLGKDNPGSKTRLDYLTFVSRPKRK